MAIEKMLLARSSGPLDKLNAFIIGACLNGSYHPEEAVRYLSASLGYSVLSEESPYSSLLAGLKELAAFAGMELETVPIESESLTVDSEYATNFIGELRDDLKDFLDERRELAEQIEKCRDGIAKYAHFLDLDVRIDDLLACEFLKIRFGSIPKDSYAKLGAYKNNPFLFFTLCSSDANNCWGVYCAPVDKIDEIDRIFASLYFERLFVSAAAGTVQEIIGQIEENIRIAEEKTAEIDGRILAYWEQNDSGIFEIYTRLLHLDAAFALRRYAAKHDDEFYCVGWIPARSLKKFKASLKGIDGVECEIGEPEKDGKNPPPTKLRNLPPFRPFEYYVEMYGLPDYGSVDITSFVAVTYTLLFGMMFGDLGQGLVLMLAGFLMWKLKGMALGKILVPCGVSSMFFGLMFGSVFGYEELLDPLYHAVGLRGKPLSVMESINTVLLVAIGIGIVLVVLSMCINIYTCLKAKRVGEALFDNNGLAGIVFYLSAVNLAVGFMGGTYFVPASVCAVLMGVMAVVLFFKEILIGLLDERRFKKPESTVDFILQNLFELLEYVLSYFSNTVSFLRVGAFVLVHAGMMMVVFSLAGESGNLAIIILGNLLVICLEGLLTGIQALRLEFYEMFSRCFEGSGRPFIGATVK